MDQVDLVKIDIEGFEGLAFKGAESLLTGKSRPAIIFEFADWAEERAGLKPGFAQAVLVAFGYGLYLIGRNGKLNKLECCMKQGSSNILALPYAL